MPAITVRVNGLEVTKEVDTRTLLSTFIREQLKLTGTHVGCDTSQCGACVVTLNGKTVKSCAVFAWEADGADIGTIEGLSDYSESGGELHPMQAAFREHHGLQCGFCTPGMVMTAVQLVKDNPDIDEDGIRYGLEGNICRCTGYQNIIEAVKTGAKAMRG
ncbi:(2Fe-2S)-binding protein [Thalassospiraceae bacterium LMO-JJ14]|nr:(2Fe-2S)-binding protein [Thalassospiraceae bacterium LMO-JJ14]